MTLPLRYVWHIGKVQCHAVPVQLAHHREQGEGPRLQSCCQVNLPNQSATIYLNLKLLPHRQENRTVINNDPNSETAPYTTAQETMWTLQLQHDKFSDDINKKKKKTLVLVILL